MGGVIHNPLNGKKGIVRAFLAVGFSVVGFYLIITGKTVPFYIGGEYGRMNPGD